MNPFMFTYQISNIPAQTVDTKWWVNHQPLILYRKVTKWKSKAKNKGIYITELHLAFAFLRNEYR
jgi:hypothetical protein